MSMEIYIELISLDNLKFKNDLNILTGRSSAFKLRKRRDGSIIWFKLQFKAY